jgi:2-oxoglutarate ferredoxin oxidoreductase subunit alpha
MSQKRISVKFGGQSGQGINTIGKLFTQALAEERFKLFAYREYPSIIKGGVASYQIDISNKKINSSSKQCDILVAYTPETFKQYLFDIKSNGIVIYDNKEIVLDEQQEEHIKQNNITSIYLDSVTLAKNAGGIEIMSNVVMLGFVWRILNLPSDTLVDTILEHFSKKNVDLEAEKNSILAGYNSPTYRPELTQKIEIPKLDILQQKQLVITGNEALCLGAISAGVRAYYAYPMTPATSIFKFLGETSMETGVLVKQAENEITAVQMALGSMYMGTRALTATSGGGFDLMTETITCAGITETPLVIVLSQRTGAATGVPTWTGAGDLNTALKGGHGDFPRCVLATSDIESSYTLIQKALNISEQFQIPVILLTEKQLSESLFTLKVLPKDIPIERGLQDGELRYPLTDSGISPRWIPSKEKKPYIHNSDEHLEDGTSTEDSAEVIKMSQKRIQKLTTLKEQLPEPELFEGKNSKVTFVGWGTSKNPILDLIGQGEEISYLHYEYLYPLKTNTLEELIAKDRRLILIENNQTGQFGNLIMEQTGYEFKEKLLKFNGRPFFIEDILNFLNI